MTSKLGFYSWQGYEILSRGAHTGSETHRVSSSVGTKGFLSLGERGLSVKLITHLCRVPTLGIRGVILPFQMSFHGVGFN
jgi:hypothetical protein